MAHSIVLPDMLANWNWPATINPHYSEVKQASAAWFAKFGAFSPRAQQAFDRCDFSLLASLAYPRFTKEQLRTACDLMNLFFAIDEYTDVASEVEARSMVRAIISALDDPSKARPKKEWIGGEIARQFWDLAIKTLGATAQRRFKVDFKDYLNSVVTQAMDREERRVRDIQSYLEVRRRTIGAIPAFAIMEANLDIPDGIMNLPVMMELRNVATEMLCIGNDQVSYNKEQSCGDEHNMIAIVMSQLNLDAQGALNWVAAYHTQLENRFKTAYLSLPRFVGPLDLQIQGYVDGLGNWVRANERWSFMSERYFGKRGPEIQMTRTVHLLPPTQHTVDVGPQEVNDDLL